MNGKPALSILIPWYERDELRLTLAANKPAFRASDAEILILNSGGSSQRLRDLIIASGLTGVRQLDITVPRFNKSLALNTGLCQARSDTIFVLDADVVLLDDIPLQAMGERSFVTIAWVYESEPLEMNQPLTRTNGILELKFRDGSTVRHQLGHRDSLGNTRAGPGLLLAKKRDLLDIDGYNSDLQTWGWEDDDVLIRLQYVLGRRRIQSGAALHLTHGDTRRALRGSRAESGQRNFIRCCRNYNHGIFAGTYHSDIVDVAVNLKESCVESALSETPGVVPSSMSGPIYCGNAQGTLCESGRGGKRPPSISELLLEAVLKILPLTDCDILAIGMGGSRLATQLSSRCRHITGVAVNESERSIAISLENCDVVVCDKYSAEFPKQLPLSAYDIIIDPNLASHACCQQHTRALMQTYSCLLASGGWLVTVDPGSAFSAIDSCWKLTEADLACLAVQFKLRVRKAGCGVYSFTCSK